MMEINKPRARILVIEDDAELRRVVCETLLATGYRVTEAPDGLQASVLLQAKPFDLVITDLYIPKRDGFDVIMESRRSHPGIKIIAVSGHSTRVSILPVDAWLGARRTIAKHFTAQEMLKLVEEVLGET